MKEVFNFIVWFFTATQEKYLFNTPVFIIALILLCVALGSCMIVSKKNRLYIRQKKKVKNQELYKEKEAVI